jgi:GTP-binding protein HflX
MSAEEASIEGGGARFDFLEVAFQSFVAGIGFQEGNAAEHLGDQGEADIELLARHIIQCVAADDEVIGFGEIDAAEIGEAAKFQISFLAEAPHGVFAGIDAQIADARPEAFQDGLPLSFPAADVEHGAHGAFEVKFGNGEHHGRLTGAGRGGADPVFRVTIPFVEIRLVVVAGSRGHGPREAGNASGEKRSSFRFRPFFCYRGGRMFEIKPRDKMVERALLVGSYTDPAEKADAQDLLDELKELTGTLGIPVLESVLVYNRELQARYLIGSGKAEEICTRVKAIDADVIIFDNQLTPAQARNWEDLSKVLVIDRQEIILDIFGARAQTREAKIQVDLARMAYSLPRLTRAWGHLGKQGGGIGAKGEGESQLEQDRRKIRGQMDRLRRELQAVRSARATQRKDRKRAPVPNAAIVGYTNVGKSSLLRRLTGAEVLVEDKLFATLDTTTRKIALPNKQPLLLTDTVGFIRNLPHELVEAFHATLEEAALSDFLIHVLDASHPRVLEFYNTTMQVLSDLGANTKDMLVVFNKIDKVADDHTRVVLRRHFPDAVFISVHSGEGLDELVRRIGGFVSQGTIAVELRLPLARTDLLARLHRDGTVDELNYEDETMHVRATIPLRAMEVFAPFEVVEPSLEKTTL